MSIPIPLPVGSKVFITKTIFTSTFNVPTINRYDFGVAANVDVPILTMAPNTTYLFERVNFSCNIALSSYQDSIDVIPELRIKKQSTNQLVWQNAMPFINYVDNLELYNFVKTDQEDDILMGTFVGSLFQVPATVGKVTISAFISFNVYQITSTDWNNYFDGEKTEEGVGIPLRGDPRGW